MYHYQTILFMKFLCSFILFLLLISCHEEPQLQVGTWSGSITPMNHPEMANPISYKVTYPEEVMTIDILGPDSSLISERNVRFENDTLFFQFDEPEEQVPLDCELGRQANQEVHFSGRCTDASGQWALFTMIVPK